MNLSEQQYRQLVMDFYDLDKTKLPIKAGGVQYDLIVKKDLIDDIREIPDMSAMVDYARVPFVMDIDLDESK